MVSYVVDILDFCLSFFDSIILWRLLNILNAVISSYSSKAEYTRIGLWWLVDIMALFIFDCFGYDNGFETDLFPSIPKFTISYQLSMQCIDYIFVFQILFRILI
jgi:hypothetical protein